MTYAPKCGTPWWRTMSSGRLSAAEVTDLADGLVRDVVGMEQLAEPVADDLAILAYECLRLGHKRNTAGHSATRALELVVTAYLMGYKARRGGR